MDEQKVPEPTTKAKDPFPLDADPFDTGFVFNRKLTTDQVIAFMQDKDDFLGEGDEHHQPEIWKAYCKAAIKNGWFTAPGWSLSDVGAWSLNQTLWLYTWLQLKYAELLRIPFG